MLKQLKRELLQSPQSIVNILEQYDFYKVRIQNNEIRCGIGEGHNPTSIRIKLVNNDNLFVSDYSRAISYDLINYIIKTRKAEFSDVLKVIKSELGISDFYEFSTKQSIFGGFYDRIRKKDSELYVKTYNETLLSEYQNVYSARFLKDNISFSAQDYFHIGYDTISQRITIPIYNAYGELIGVKGRATWETAEDEPKYLYIVPCPMSSTLYGYCQNYSYLCENDVYVFEAEKSVLQCYSFGVRNCVSLGSNSLSNTQCKLLMSLNPTRIIFILDKGLDYENTKRNSELLNAYLRMSDTKIFWWDWTKNTTLPDKASPSDFGRENFNRIQNEIAEVVF